MGKIKQGILGGFNGTVGTVVGGSWKGISYMRGKAQSIKNPKTPAQMAQRAFFSEISSLANQLTDDQLKTFFPNAVRGLTRRNILFKQLAAACTVTAGAKAFDATKLDTLGNSSGTFNFGTITVMPLTTQGPGGVTTFVQLDVIIENMDDPLLNTYGVFIVINVTKGTIHAINSTRKMNVPNSIAALPGWENTDTFKVLPFLYDSQTAVVGFGTMTVIERPARKNLSL